MNSDIAPCRDYVSAISPQGKYNVWNRSEEELKPIPPLIVINQIFAIFAKQVLVHVY